MRGKTLIFRDAADDVQKGQLRGESSLPTGTKVGSMAWNFLEKLLPCRGKIGKFGFHGVETPRI
jgi:hypothetical protein